MQILLLISLLCVATCGLVYELVSASLASLLLGDSVLQFSTIIGTYLFAMGVGAYLASYLQNRLLVAFLQIQYAMGMIGGLSALILWFNYSYAGGFKFLLYLLVSVIGLLVGLELPLLLRILRQELDLKVLVSRVLGLDYLGALLGAIALPLFFAPRLGLVKTCLFFGLVNVTIALLLCAYLDEEGRWPLLKLEGAALLVLLALCMAGSNKLIATAEQARFPDPIILSRNTHYQRIVVTRRRADIRLFLNNNLQFSSRDEYRYHEALVVPGLRSVAHPRRVLVMGGGDGLAVETLLRDQRVEKIVLVELDPVMTDIFANHPLLSRLNRGALRDPRVKVVNQDAFVWLRQTDQRFDLAVVDFPDPSNYSLGKLYTEFFYRQLRARLNSGGVMTVQCSSPFFARRTFWCIAKTLENAGFQVRPYHVFVPSFGEWGFCLAGTQLPEQYLAPTISTRYLDEAEFARLFEFPKDMARLEVEGNRLFDQQLVRYFQADWSQL